MNFTPKMPGVVPMSYGQGFGDWQQYAGFNKDNPFGALPAQQPIAPPVATEPYKPTAEMPQVDYAIKPPATQFGAPSTGFSTPDLSLQIPSLADQARKYFGD
jgi:hypothetical protein